MPEPEKQKALRLFVAVSPTEEIRARVAAILDALRREDRSHSVRWVAAENVHLTLRFLGASPPERVPELRALLDEVGGRATPMELDLSGCGAFPDWRRPRVVWLGIAPNGALAGLVQAVEEGVTRLGYAPEDRPYRPHLTLGRVRPGARAGQGLEGAARAASGTWSGRWRVETLALYESEPGPKGAVYRALHRAPLTAADADPAPANR
ncbi:MAG: RNA 2',3'-cyclic phosphodiesterase [Myxococcales bacterium]|nr:RNA 2',3'-cyclic phosphodiesterase [Myxococcales bacterium]